MDTPLAGRTGGSRTLLRGIAAIEVTEGIVADEPVDVTIEGAGSVSGPHY